MTFAIDQLFTTWWEFFGVITGILSVAFLLPTKYPRLQYLNWPAGVMTAAIYTYIFTEWELYGNAALQVYFVLVCLVGAWTWRGQLRGLVSDVPEIPITTCPWSEVWKAGLFALAISIPIIGVLTLTNDAHPIPDGAMVALSAAAIWLQLKKYVQSWFFWIAVDCIAIPLHASQGLGATAALYAIYMAMCFVGYRQWAKEAENG